MLRKLILVFGVFAANVCSAAVLSWTGAELLSEPRASFPGQTFSVDGDALVYDPSDANFEKLLEIRLVEPGAISLGDAPTQFSVAINLTRLSNDWDPHIGLGDGTQILAALPTDNGFLAAEELVDAGSAAVRQLQVPVFTHSGLPPVGGVVDFSVDFLLNDIDTAFTASLLGATGTYEAITPLDRSAGLSLVLTSDNDAGERYRINSITVSGPLSTVPEPGSALLLLTALGCLVASRYQARTSFSCNGARQEHRQQADARGALCALSR